MKVGIITFTGSSNYGCHLQNYAVVKSLESLGLDVYTVKTNYCYSCFSADFIKTMIKKCFDKGVYLRDYRVIKFYSFCRKYLNLSKTQIIEEAPVDNNYFDYFILGSDQIWNCSYTRVKNALDYYTGAFSKVPVISYSASLGIDYIPADVKEKFISNINKINSISVRENKAKELLSKYIKNEISVTIDPVFMLSRKEWLSIASDPEITDNKKFILTYFLGSVKSEVKAFINKIAEINNFEIVNLYGEWEKNIENTNSYLVSPNEFVWLFNNCEIVFTDSYHGSVFSVIMDKPFRCFKRVDENENNISSRMDTLFSLLKIENHCAGDVDEDINNIFKYDYTETKTIISGEQTKLINYLKNSLNL